MKRWLCDSCCGNNCPEGAYPQEQHCEGYEKTKMYMYGMRLRGFSIGCQPMSGLVERHDDETGKYHDVLVYNRQLTEEEVKSYELEYIE